MQIRCIIFRQYLIVFSLMPHPDFLLPYNPHPITTVQPKSEVAYEVCDLYPLVCTKKHPRGVSIIALFKREQRSSLGIWPKVEGGGGRDKGQCQGGVETVHSYQFPFPFLHPI